jgi:OFA family oxalate/formate antiporter-like MFS transporter
MRDHTMAQKEHTWIPNLGAKGWGITFICICFYFFYNFWNNASNTLFGVLTGMYGWETTQMSFIVTLGGWCSLLGIIVFGVIGRKVGAKNVSIIGLIGSIIAFVILATMSNFTMFAVGTLLFYVTMVGYAVIGLGKFGSEWFPHKKGVFMGFATMGMTICGAMINPVILACAGSSAGISSLFWGLAVFYAIVIVLIAAFAKNTPEEAGAFPDNDRSITREALMAEAKAAEEYKKNSPWTIQKVLKTKETWLIGIGWGLSMLAASGVMALLVPTLASYDHDPVSIVALLASMWPMGLLGHYLIGVIDQKIGTKKTTVFVVVLQMVDFLCIAFFGGNYAVCAIAIGLLMFAISGNANVCMSMTTSVFGRADFEMAWTPIQVIYNICNFSGVTVIALITASFGPHAVMIGAALICLVSLVFIGLCSDKQIGSQIGAAKQGDGAPAVTAQ